VIEFGTLPGAHNFLREWEGEASFSSWALQWGRKSRGTPSYRPGTWNGSV
jgi:hypothetical protein